MCFLSSSVYEWRNSSHYLERCASNHLQARFPGEQHRERSFICSTCTVYISLAQGRKTTYVSFNQGEKSDLRYCFQNFPYLSIVRRTHYKSALLLSPSLSLCWPLRKGGPLYVGCIFPPVYMHSSNKTRPFGHATTPSHAFSWLVGWLVVVWGRGRG